MDIREIARYRGEFFRVLQQTERSQTAVMTIAAAEDAGPEETHRTDQIIYIVEGEAVLRVDGDERRAGAGALVVIPAGARHHVRNPGRTPLFLVTVYAPPEY
jgi:mannose-6-phosphate isomerase-like protein (cupin superfamily)